MVSGVFSFNFLPSGVGGVIGLVNLWQMAEFSLSPFSSHSSLRFFSLAMHGGVEQKR